MLDKIENGEIHVSVIGRVTTGIVRALPMDQTGTVPLSMSELQTACDMAVAGGTLATMMTATIVDDLTDTTSDRNRECKGQGIANIGSGLIGGMAGCAMIGQSIINVKSGGYSPTPVPILFSGIGVGVAFGSTVGVGLIRGVFVASGTGV